MYEKGKESYGVWMDWINFGAFLKIYSKYLQNISFCA